MKRLGVKAVGGVLVWGLAAWSCADWDNPTALSEMDLSTAFDVHATRVETFEAVEIHVEVMSGGSPLGMQTAELEVEHAASGAVQTFPMEPGEHGYAASVTFFQPGEHHLHFHGMPEHHSLIAELGEHEVGVHRRHEVIGPYWVELELSPAPVIEGGEGHIHVLVYELMQDETPGTLVTGLTMGLEIHDPSGAGVPLVVTEEAPGEYESAYSFTAAGVYELHVEIEVDGVHEGGEFHIPVLSETGDEVDDHGGDGHDHSH